MKKTPGIRTYLILSHGLLLTISLVAIGFIWSHSEYQVVTQELQKLMSERATLLSNIVAHELAESRGLEFRGVDSTNIPLERDMTAVYIDLTGFPYELTPGSVSSQDAELLLELNSKYHVSHGNITTLLVMDNGSSSVYAASPVFDSQAQQVGTVCLLLPIGYLDGYITRLRWLLAGVVIVVTLLSVGVSTLLTNYFSRHFSRAQELAATVANGDYHLRIPESGPDELRNLSHYLNHMAEELQEQLKMRQTLLANVAHELARPLAGLQLGIESLRKGAVRDPDLSDELLVNMQQTVQRLSSLVDDITLSALPKTKPLELHRQLIDVEPFLKGLSTRFLPLAEARGLRLEVRVEAGLPPINIDEKRVHQIVGNLMDNAIKFTPHDGVIRLSAERASEHQVLIAIHDSGSGIDPKELENIFEPFYQGDIGRRVKQGMGLGLAIAHQLAVAHGGDLFLKNHQDGGVIAVLTLPIDFP